MASLLILLGCLLGIHITSTEASTEDNTILTEEDSFSAVPVFLLGAIQACVSVAAFMQISQSPVPDPNRLPGSVTPLCYNVHLANDAENRNFWGQVQILVHATDPVATIGLHAKDLILTENTLSIVDEAMGHAVKTKSVQYEPENEWYLLELDTPLVQGNNYTISVSYKSSRLTVNNLGIECVKKTSGNTTRWLQFSRFEPSGARTVFPCFDEPSWKARFKINIATPPGMHALSNMPLRDASEPVKELPGWVWSRFEESVPMSTYLVAFTVTDFVSVVSEGGRNLTTWITAGQEERVKLVAKALPDIITAMEELPGVPYSLPKLDNVVIPESRFASFSGLENWGLIAYDSSAIVTDIEKNTMEEIRSTLVLVAHEVAHMWFGNLVTPAWWDHLWLKEGFADYFSYLVMKKLYPEQRPEEHFVVNVVHFLLASESGFDTMHQAVASLDEIEEKYSIQAYTKGSVMARMLDNILTPHAFRVGINQYLQRHSFKSAAAKDLFDALEGAANGTLPEGVSLAEVMDSWVTKGGFPLITVTRDYDKGEATVCQEVFRSVRGSNSSSWWVPLSYTTEIENDFNNTVPRVWLPANQSCVTVTGLPGRDKWVIFNIQLTGYYRVNYDSHNWLLLAKFLKSERYSDIHVLNRAQLLDDGFNLMKYGLLEVAVWLKLMQYLDHETSATPWLVFVRKRPFCTVREQENYLSKAVELVKEMTNKPEEQGVSYLWYSILETVCNMACAPSNCLENYYPEFIDFKKDPVANRLKPEIRRQVLCSGLSDDRATEEDLMFVWNLGRFNSTVASERDDIAFAAFECPNTELQYRSLALLMSRENDWIQPREVQFLFYAMCLRQETAQEMNEILSLIETLHPLLHVMMPALKTITPVLAELHGSHEEWNRMWCYTLSQSIYWTLKS